jgi:hypothetical protein
LVETQRIWLLVTDYSETVRELINELHALIEPTRPRRPPAARSGETDKGAVGYYLQPFEASAQIKDRVAF